MKTKLNRRTRVALGSLLLAAAIPAFSHPWYPHRTFDSFGPYVRVERVWMPPMWVDRGAVRVFVPGHWMHRHLHWAPGEYVRMGHRVYFVPGHWER
ncbi:MAG: hypothetical protein JWN85_1069 [Gammaproteobacteria bacterium]|jgi:hypothetical protein|nr:hypothetical protein [Gammaproteobacteria bacterium]